MLQFRIDGRIHSFTEVTGSIVGTDRVIIKADVRH